MKRLLFADPLQNADGGVGVFAGISLNSPPKLYKYEVRSTKYDHHQDCEYYAMGGEL